MRAPPRMSPSRPADIVAVAPRPPVAQNIYITAMGPHSGKSVVALGFTEMLSARLQRVGFFRPVIRGATDPDPQIELMRDRYQLPFEYAEMHGPTAEEVTGLTAHGAHEEIEKRVLAAYRELASRCDFVVCEGTDFVGSTPALDFDLNANLANQLGRPVLVVVNGAARRRRRRGGAARARGAAAQRLRAVRRDRQPRGARRRARSRATAGPAHRPGVGIRDARARRARLPERRRGAGRARRPPGAGRRWHARPRRARGAGRGDERRALHRGPRRRHPGGGAGRSLGHRRRLPRLDALTVLPGGLRAAADGRLLHSRRRVRGLLETAPFPVLEIDARTHVAAAAIAGVRPVLRAGERAQDRDRARPLRAQRRQGRAADALHGGAPGADDPEHVRVRADRARQGGAPAHRAARGRGRARAAGGRHPAAPRRRRLDGAGRPRRGARQRRRAGTRSGGSADRRSAAARRCASATPRSTTSCASTRA